MAIAIRLYIVLYCIVFIHFYSASHSLSLSEALPTTAVDTVSEFTGNMCMYLMYSFPFLFLARLADLRSSTLLVDTVSNIIWLIFVVTLASKSKALDVLCTNPLGRQEIIFHESVYSNHFSYIMYRTKY